MAKKRRRRFVCVTHSATLTGAPLITSALVRHLSQDKDLVVDYVFLSSQSFGKQKSLAKQEYPANVCVISGLSKLIFLTFHSVRSYVIQRLKCNSKKARQFALRNGIQLIYVSSIASLESGYILKQSTGAKLVLHLHEMYFWIKSTSLTAPDFQKYLNMVDLIIAPAEQCITSLKAVADVCSKTNVVIIPEPSNIHQDMNVACLESDIDQSPDWTPIKVALNSGKAICICNGTDSWRKGLDYFLLSAALLNNANPGKFHFVWISLSMSVLDKIRAEIECSHLGISDDISFMEPIEDLRKLLRVSTCYMLTSREDPMPVAALEAMAEDIPVICFKGTGAIPDMLEGSALQVVPYGNPTRFAESVYRLAFDIEARLHAISFQHNLLAKCSSDVVFEMIRTQLNYMCYAD